MQILQRHFCDYFSRSQVWLVRSDHVPVPLRICISAPDAAPGERAGAVYAADAALLGGPLVGALRSCRLGGELPPLYAVSIGYPHDGAPDLVQRTRELTPTSRADFDRFMPALTGSDAVVASGGANGFATFLLAELRPCIASEFGLDPTADTLAGASLGGLFALHLLLSWPDAFRRYLAISPSLWWDDAILLDRAAKAAASGPAPTASVFLCAGGDETPEAATRQYAMLDPDIARLIPAAMRNADMLGDLERMAAILSGWPPSGLRVENRTLPAESHSSVAGAAFSQGLRALYRMPVS